MIAFASLLEAEFRKLKRSSVLLFLWVYPLVFLVLEFLAFERPLLGLQVIPPDFATVFEGVQLNTLGALWVGFFHPLFLSLLPALLFRPEHKHKQWRHLHALPVSRRGIFLAKTVLTLFLCATVLMFIGMGLWFERGVLAWLNPVLQSPSHGLQLAKVLGWTWLGSLPLLGLYLWVSDRINSMAVPIVFGLLGTLMTIALSGQEIPKAWQRDLNPWLLPYACAQQAIVENPAKQAVHAAAIPLSSEPDVIRLPSGRKIKTWQNIPDEVLFPLPPPTPRWLLATFSLSAAMVLLSIGTVDAGRNRQ